MAITKLVLDRQAAGRVFTFGSSAASANVSLAKATADSTDTVVLTAEGSANIQGNLDVTGSLEVNGVSTFGSNSTFLAGIDASNNVITNVATPASSKDAVNKLYVDDALTPINSSISTLESDVTELQSDMTAVEGTVATLGADLFNLTGIVNTNSSNITDLQGDVSTLDSEVNTLQVSVNGLEATASAAAVVIEELVSDVAALEASQSLYAKLSGGNTFSGDQLFSDNVTIQGDFTVNGTQTIINSTVVDIADNIISLNGVGASYGGIEVNDPLAPNAVSGSLLWDATNDKWIAGPKGSEKDVLVANLGTNGQVLTIVDGVAEFAAAQTIATFKRGTLSGTQDGSNKVFTVAVSGNFVSDSEQVILNGIVLTPGAGYDYTVVKSGTDIVVTFTLDFPAPLADDNLQVFATF